MAEVEILDLEQLASVASPLLDAYERASPAYVGTPLKDAHTG
jgi:hypothetical protein